MFHQRIERIVDFFVSSQYVSETYRDWCVYVLERSVLSAGGFVLIFVLASMFFPPIDVLLFLASLIFIRRRAGGYHTTHIITCLLSSIAITLMGLSLARLFANTWYLLPILLVVSSSILFLAPINQPELHLSDSELRCNRKKLRSIQFFLVAVFLVLFQLRCSMCAYGVFGYTIAAILVLAAKITYRRRYAV